MIGLRSNEATVEIRHRFNCFIIFESAAGRVLPGDILLSGDAIRETFDHIIMSISADPSIKGRTLQNKLAKINQMLDLLPAYDSIIVTKFFDRIWRRYNYISNLGEILIDLETYLSIFPDAANDVQALIADRIDMSDDEDEDGDGDGDDDDTVHDGRNDHTTSLEESDDEDEDTE